MLQKIYDNSPIWFQNLMVSVAGNRNNARRYGAEYHRYMNFLSDFNKWAIEKKQEYQLTELKRLLKHANENSVFYRNLYQNIDLSTITTIDDLRKLPVVTKEMLRQNI